MAVLVKFATVERPCALGGGGMRVGRGVGSAVTNNRVVPRGPLVLT